MGRRHVVRDLNDEQFLFVINAIINGLTDREISVAFEKTFEQPLAKSSLNRWRESAGNELAERYRLARFQSKQLLENLKKEDGDQYAVILQNIEDHLLRATREVIALDPIQMLKIRQEEEKRRLKIRELELKERQLELEVEKIRSTQIDVQQLPGQFLEFLLDFIGIDSVGLSWFKKNAKELESFLMEKFRLRT